MGAKQSKENLENEFVFENPLLQTSTFQLPKNDIESNTEIQKETKDTAKESSNINNTIPKSNNNENNINRDNTVNANFETNVKTETFETINEDIKSSSNKPKEEEITEIKKEKKKKFEEEPLPSEDNTFKPLDLMKADEILSPEIVEDIIEEHVKEELYRLQKDQKILNFKRDKLLERTINIIKYGNSNFNYKDINDKYRKSQKKVLECMSNNSHCTLSERDIACYQEFEEFKDNIRMLYKKYYNA